MPDTDELWRMVVEQGRTLATNQQAIVILQENYREEQRKTQDRAEDVAAALLTLSRKQEEMNNTLERAKGGWLMLITLGGIGCTLIAAGAWVWINIFHGTPK
jgi:hypothetical protein